MMFKVKTNNTICPECRIDYLTKERMLKHKEKAHKFHGASRQARRA